MAILFDLDGTLIDTANDIIWAVNALCVELNKPLTDVNLLRDNVSFGLETILTVASINVKDLSDVELKRLKHRFKELYKQSNFRSSKLFPGVDLIITDIKQKGLKIGVVTNKTLEFAQPNLEKVNLSNKIDCLITSDMVANPKPYPDSVLLAIKTLQVDPKDCLFIGDAEQDIIAGNAAGVKTAVALFGYVGDQKTALSWPANYFLKTPIEIWSLVDSLYF